MPTPCYISITGQTQGNITAGAFTADLCAGARRRDAGAGIPA